MTRQLIIICLILSLSGCGFSLFPILASGGGGYLASREVKKAKIKSEAAEQKRRDRELLQARTSWEKERAQAQTTDERLTATLNQQYLGGGLTRILSVNTQIQNGVVTLYGNVPNEVVADRAVEIARRTNGVRDVISKLTIVEMEVTPVTQAQSPAFHLPKTTSPTAAAAPTPTPLPVPIMAATPAPAKQSIRALRDALRDPNAVPKNIPPPQVQQQLPPSNQFSAPPMQAAPPINSQQPMGAVAPVRAHIMKPPPPKPAREAAEPSAPVSFVPDFVPEEEAAPRPPMKAGSRAHWAPTRELPPEMQGLVPADKTEAREMLKESGNIPIDERGLWDRISPFRNGPEKE